MDANEAIGSGARLHISTRERRYILQDEAPLRQLLQSRGAPIKYQSGRAETEITTVYLDTAEGTWSRGLSRTKIRVRTYQDPTSWWLELKWRQDERVDKWRRPLSIDAVFKNLAGVERWDRLTALVGAAPLRPYFAVRCHRTAFEWAGLRVTLDRALEFFAVDPARPLQLSEQIGWLDGLVVEVKCVGEVPLWLQPVLAGHLATSYSKPRYARALLAGLDRLYLVKETDEVTGYRG
jgi:hypothetical protein